MTKTLSYAEDVRMNYDPEQPAHRFMEALPEKARETTSERLPIPVPWPEALKPTPVPLTPVPRETDDLSRFAGYEAIVVTYTSAEAASLAALFTPGHPGLDMVRISLQHPGVYPDRDREAGSVQFRRPAERTVST